MMKHRHRPDVAPLFAKAFGKRPAEELYDVRRDPGQMNNVADDPAYAEELQRMRRRLEEEMRATGDPRADDRGEQFDTYPYYWRDPRAAN
jgi:arylsulfatase A-like enzyme